MLPIVLAIKYLVPSCWQYLGSMALLEEVCPLTQAFRVERHFVKLSKPLNIKAIFSALSLLPAVG